MMWQRLGVLVAVIILLAGDPGLGAAPSVAGKDAKAGQPAVLSADQVRTLVQTLSSLRGGPERKGEKILTEVFGLKGPESTRFYPFEEFAHMGESLNAGFPDLTVHLVSGFGTPALLADLLDNGFSALGPGRWWESPLHWAALRGRTDQARQLLQRGARVQARDSWDRTPLHCAARGGHAETVEALLEAGADPRSVSREGQTPLHMAALRGWCEVIRRLLATRMDVDSRNGAWLTPLHLAAMEGHAGAVRLLLGARANPNAADQEGRTPLHLAVQLDRLDAVETLLSFGADTFRKNNQGIDPYQVAEKTGSVPMQRLLVDRHR